MQPLLMVYSKFVFAKTVGQHYIVLLQCIFFKLTELDLSWCKEVTDTGLSAIIRRCTSLQTLLLRQCSISESLLHDLSHSLTQLKELNLANIGTVTDAVLVTMATQLVQLEKFDVSWNMGRT